MAGHVNGAIGVKLAHPDRAVVVGCGDGCYLSRLRADDRRRSTTSPSSGSSSTTASSSSSRSTSCATYGETGARRVPEPRLRRLRASVRRGRLPRRDARGVRGRVRRGAGVQPAHRDRRQDHALGAPALQPVARGRRRRPRRAARGAASRRMTGQPANPVTRGRAARMANAARRPGRRHPSAAVAEAERSSSRSSRTRSCGAAQDGEDCERPRRPHPVDRAFHAKATLAVDDAELRFLDLAPDLQCGLRRSPARPTARMVRFSNAAGMPRADDETGPARCRAAYSGVGRRAARPAGDQLPGLARARRPPVRRVRQGDRRRCALAAARHPRV